MIQQTVMSIEQFFAEYEHGLEELKQIALLPAAPGKFRGKAWKQARLLAQLGDNAVGYLLDIMISCRWVDVNQAVPCTYGQRLRRHLINGNDLISENDSAFHRQTSENRQKASYRALLISLLRKRHEYVQSEKQRKVRIRECALRTTYSEDASSDQWAHKTLFEEIDQLLRFQTPKPEDDVKVCMAFHNLQSAKAVEDYLHLLSSLYFWAEIDYERYSQCCVQLIELKVVERLSSFWKGFLYWHAGNDYRKDADEFLSAVIKQENPEKNEATLASQLLISASNIPYSELSTLVKRASMNTGAPAHKTQKPLPFLQMRQTSRRSNEAILSDIQKYFSDDKKREELAFELSGKLLRKGHYAEEIHDFFVFYTKPPTYEKNYMDAIVTAAALLMGIMPEEIEVVQPSIALNKENEFISDVVAFENGIIQNLSEYLLPAQGKKLLYYQEIHRWSDKLQAALWDYLKTRLNAQRDNSLISISYVKSSVKNDYRQVGKEGTNFYVIAIPCNYGVNCEKEQAQARKWAEDDRIMAEYEECAGQLNSAGKRAFIQGFVESHSKLSLERDGLNEFKRIRNRWLKRKKKEAQEAMNKPISCILLPYK